MYTYQEALTASIEYFNGNEYAARVFCDKYALKNGNILMEKTPDDMHRRLSREFARIQFKKYGNKGLSEETIYSYLKDFSKIIPQGSPCFAIGNPYQIASISNCFVVESPIDSYGGICKTDEELAQISKRRGGVGADVSNIRPRNTPTKNSSRYATGILLFMHRYSNTIREVGQDGRRGALMLSCDIHHPESVIPWDPTLHGEEFEVEVNNKELGKYKISSKWYNPNVLDFATCKYDSTKVTGANISLRLSDEFLSAVENKTTFQKRWPPVNPTFTEDVSATAVWDKIIYSAWRTAEPGILFWDNIIRESPADCYSDVGFRTISTNPCLTGETLVAVADGRSPVSISQLAKENKDVPVYCCDDKGRVVIRNMRNPRLTGFKKKIYKVTLEDNLSFRCTENHKLMLNDGKFVECSNLRAGDSLHIAYKDTLSFKDIFGENSTNKRSQNYIWMGNSFGDSRKAEHRLIHEYYSGEKIKKTEVIHHKDFDAQNNSFSNLQKMSKQDHDAYHAKNMFGENNPMRRLKKDIQKYTEYCNAMSERNSGLKNSNSINITNEEIKQHAISLTKKLGRRFSQSEWSVYAKENNIPIQFSPYRKAELGNITKLAKTVARECGYTEIDTDPRVVDTLNQMIQMGYVSRIDGSAVLVQKTCACCNSIFETHFSKRETAVCGARCANLYTNKTTDTNERRTKTINETYKLKSAKTKKQQLDIFTSLRMTLNRTPSVREWEDACNKAGISHRLGTKHGFQTFQELTLDATSHNHRIISIVEDGEEDVFNGTVDEFHNFYMGGWETTNEHGKKRTLFVNNQQCGEIPLSANDSCRLLVINLFGFVVNPYTPEAYFDYEAFYRAAEIAQRLMDDIVDLEEECIVRIINKIKSDPETLDIKHRELALWEKMLVACQNGRRTGTGITALGDSLAAIGVKYGSREGINATEYIYKTLKFGCYSASVDMAEALGAFPVWNSEKEKNNPFLNRIRDEFLDLRPQETARGNATMLVSGAAIWEKMQEYGRRNIACLTTAPVGTISSLCKLLRKFGSTSGIEPHYSWKSYTRKKKGNPTDADFRTDSIDQNGDHWMHFRIYPTGVQEWIAATGNEDVEKSPFFGNTAEEIDWELRVELQAAAQRHIDHSISSTVNLPNSATVEDVAKIYNTAWKKGCKGITVYRDGCRTGVLVKDEVPGIPAAITKTTAPKRPKLMDCEIYHSSVKGETYFVVIGFLNGQPYEVFAGQGDNLKSGKGKLVKINRGHYRLTTDHGESIENICDLLTDEQAVITRMISLSLRHGSDIQFIVDQIEKSPGDMYGFGKAVGRILKKHIPDGTRVSGQACETCGSTSLTRQEGCVSCKDCGNSKCG